MVPGPTEQTALLVIDMQTFFQEMVSEAMMENITNLVRYFRSLDVPDMATTPHMPGLVVFTQHGHTSEELDVPSAEESPNQLVRKWGINGSIREGTEDWKFMGEVLVLLGDDAQVIPSKYMSSGDVGDGKGKGDEIWNLREQNKTSRRGQKGETVAIPKNTYDAFINTQLEEVLICRGIKRVVVCGVMTDCCCDTTARAAFNRGFETWLVKDACASANKTQHERGLKAFEYAFGEVVTTREALAALNLLEEEG